MQVVLPHPKKQELDVVVFLDDSQVLRCAVLCCAALGRAEVMPCSGCFRLLHGHDFGAVLGLLCLLCLGSA